MDKISLYSEEDEHGDFLGHQWVTEEAHEKLSWAFLQFCMKDNLDIVLNTIQEFFDCSDFKFKETLTDEDLRIIRTLIHLRSCCDSIYGFITNKKNAELAKDWVNSVTWHTVRGIVDQVSE